MAFRKLFFKRVQGYNRDNYLLQEGDIALDEDDFQLYRGDGSTIGGVVIAGATSAVPVSTGNGTDISITGGESTATGSTGGNTVITGGIGVATGGNVNINGGNGSTDGNINIGTENTTLITIGTSGNNIDFPATTTIDFTGATVTGLGVSGIANDIVNDTTPQLGGNLDLNNFDITGTGDINITGTVTASGGVTLAGTTDVDTITTDGLTITDNNVSANRSNDDLILSSSGTGSININGTVTGTGVLDEDDMSSNSANHLATQQSIKAYVDSQSGGGGSSLQSRATKAGTTGSLADAAQADLDITGFKAYALLTISTDRAARVRLYVSAATRTADASRAEGTDPTSDAGLIAEVITTGAQTVIISPGAYGFNLESSPTTTIPCRVTNKSGSTSTVQVTLNVLQLEA